MPSTTAASAALSAGTKPLRFIPQANLTSLDPVWTTAVITYNHAYMVCDTLYGIDAAGELDLEHHQSFASEGEFAAGEAGDEYPGIGRLLRGEERKRAHGRRQGCDSGKRIEKHRASAMPAPVQQGHEGEPEHETFSYGHKRVLMAENSAREPRGLRQM